MDMQVSYVPHASAVRPEIFPLSFIISSLFMA